MNVRLTFALVVASLGACSGDPAPSDAGARNPVCDVIASRCHRYDTGSGTAHDCHQFAEGNNVALCTSRQAECLAACPATPPSDGGTGDASTTTNVEVRFRAMVGATPFACGTTYMLGRTMAAWNPLDFRFYVSNVRLVTGDGREVPVALTQDGTWQRENLALLDFEDRTGGCMAGGTAQTNTSVRGTVPSGSYTGLRFTLGVPFAMNHGNAATAPSPLNLSAMFWAWNAGYKFLKIDGRTQIPSFNVHVGSTGCRGDGAGTVSGCSASNRAEVSLTGFDPARNAVVADLARLVENVNVDQSAGAPGCMSTPDDPECGPVFAALGLVNGMSSGTQTFFRVE